VPVAEVALNPDLSGALSIEATEATRPRPHPRQIHCLVESVSEVVVWRTNESTAYSVDTLL
jgi:hypothetical protein